MYCAYCGRRHPEPGSVGLKKLKPSGPADQLQNTGGSSDPVDKLSPTGNAPHVFDPGKLPGGNPPHQFDPGKQYGPPAADPIDPTGPVPQLPGPGQYVTKPDPPPAPTTQPAPSPGGGGTTPAPAPSGGGGDPGSAPAAPSPQPDAGDPIPADDPAQTGDFEQGPPPEPNIPPEPEPQKPPPAATKKSNAGLWIIGSLFAAAGIGAAIWASTGGEEQDEEETDS